MNKFLILLQVLNPRNIVEKLTEFLEFLVDHFNNTGGHILIKASPLIAPLPSGWAVYNALSVSSTSFALVVAFVVEGLGFAAVDARNKIEAHNRANPNEQVSDAKAKNLVMAYFAVTMITILSFETVPAWAHYFSGESTIVLALYATAPLVFPIFANLGASIYSLMDVLAKVANKSTVNLSSLGLEVDRLNAEILRLNSEHRTAYNELVERAHNEHRTLTEQLANMTALYNAITLENARMSGILETMKDSEQHRTSSVQRKPDVRSQSSEKVNRQNKLYRLLKEQYNGMKTTDFNKTEVGNLLGTTRITIGRDLEDLVKANLITVNGVISVK